jgi:hypothetical protein
MSEPGVAPVSDLASAPPAEQEAVYGVVDDDGSGGWVGDEEYSESYDETVVRMVIRTASLELIVPDTAQSLDEIADIAADFGGYVVSLNTYQYQEGLQGNVTIRVPSESFDLALDRLKDLATTVRRESISGQDVTEEYVDLGSSLRHLQALEAQLLEFLDEAEDTEAVLAVYEELSTTQQEIEYVRGRMQYLENQTALATITIDLTPDAMAQPLEVSGWDLPATFRDSVEDLLNALEFLVKALIRLITFVLPLLIILLAPVVGLVFLIRWLVQQRKRRRVKAE